MPRRHRIDPAGACFHVMNRALGRRPAFEDDVDRRHFLSRLAWVAHLGYLRILAFVLMGNHFHLVVVSPDGRLPEAMHIVEFEYTQRFNQRRGRDGPLWRGRYKAKLVGSRRHRVTVIRYSDNNPVEAGLVRIAADWPWSSAWHYARATGPPWLDRSWVEGLVKERTSAAAYDPAQYATVFGRSLSAPLQALITRRIEAQDAGDDPLDALLEAKPRDMTDWLAARAALADGAPKLLPVADGTVTVAVVAEAEAAAGAWVLTSKTRRRSAWELVRVALLLDLCVEPVTAVASRVGMSHTNVRRTYVAHAARLQADPIYRTRVGELGCEVIRRCHAE